MLMDVNKTLKSILITISRTTDDPFPLDVTTFEQALKADKFLSSLDLVFYTPPQDDGYCISPKYCPDL